MLSSSLLRASRSHRARRIVEATSLTRNVVSRFVAGEEASDAVRATSELASLGRTTTIDVLGEDAHDAAGARRTRDSYLTLINALVDSGAKRGTDLSLKPSLGTAPSGPRSALSVMRMTTR